MGRRSLIWVCLQMGKRSLCVGQCAVDCVGGEYLIKGEKCQRNEWWVIDLLKVLKLPTTQEAYYYFLSLCTSVNHLFSFAIKWGGYIDTNRNFHRLFCLIHTHTHTRIDTICKYSTTTKKKLSGQFSVIMYLFKLPSIY